MKTKLFSLFLALVASVGTIIADGTKIGDLYYNLDADNLTAEVTYQAYRSSSNYSGLTSADIQSSVTYNSQTYSVTGIGEEAFRKCGSLTSVTICNSVTSIGDYAFGFCSSLTSVTIGNSVTSIGENAFYYCSSLTSVNIPNSVTSIGDAAFEGCSSLTSPVYNEHVFAFMPTTYSGNYSIPEGIESIAGEAFYGCSSLISVTIPNSVTSIGNYAFSNCSSLTSVTIGNSVTSIGDWAFEDCSSLTTITMKAETPPSLGDLVFVNVNISAIYVPCNTASAYKSAWPGYANRIKYAPLPYKISTQAENGSVTTTDVTTLTICDEPFITCTATPDYGYHFTQWSDGLKDNPRIFRLTQDTTFTAEFAYDRVGQCGKDLALVWSYDPANKVLTIGNAGEFTENMQFGAEAPAEMEELVIGNNVTAIGANAFAGIETLKKVSIGESVKTIGEQAFFNCVNLETIYNYRATPTNAYSTAFDGVDKFECALYVLPNSIDMYKNASVWRDFYYTYAIGATTATVNEVSVTPTVNTAEVAWPAVENAATYELIIKDKNGNVICTLVFNANGQLTSIAFAAPGRTQTSGQTAGFTFTVTGLEAGTSYDLTITAKDESGAVIETTTQSFTTADVPSAVDNVNTGDTRLRKMLIDGQLLILRDGKIYTVQGQQLQ